MYTEFFELLENSPFIFHSIDENGCLTHVSNKWLEFFGYEREEVIGKKSTLYLTETSRKYAEEVILPSFFKIGKCDSVHYQYIKKDNSVVDMLLSGVMIEENGKKHSIAFLTDITEQIKDQKELEEHRNNLEELVKQRTEEMNIAMEMYKTLARTSPVAIMRTDESGKCKFVNQRWIDFTDQSKEEAKDDGWMNAIYEEDKQKIKNIWIDAVLNRKNWTEEFRLINKDGDILWVLCSGNTVNGKCGHVMTFTNITKRKEILPQLISLQKSLKEEAVKRSIKNGI